VAKYRYSLDEARIARRLKEGRGQGHKADYKPWLTIHDVSSRGLSVRMLGRKTDRLHHLLSGNLEQAAFLDFDWADEVVDIREQFPLDRDETRSIAVDMGIPHPRDVKTQIDIVMTTDFVLDVQSGSKLLIVAWAIKPEDQLNSARVLEKLEIERRYWERRRVNWRIATEREMPFQRAQNLRYFNEMRSLEGIEAPHPNYWPDRCKQFLSMIKAYPNDTFGEMRERLAAIHAFGESDLLTVFRHLTANKLVTVNMDISFDFQGKLDQLAFGEKD
jgi:hypothetical protein